MAEPESQAPLTVELFDPSNPVAPHVELAANFDPHLHVRWASRPAVAELDFTAVEVDGKPLPEPVQHQLREAGLVTIKAILGGGLEAVRAAGVRGKVAEDFMAWVSGRNAAQHALAELAAERLAGVSAPVPAAPPTPPTTTAPTKPSGTGDTEGEAGAG